jgi:GAF domain-containing protein/HAMP domain-containing protein
MTAQCDQQLTGQRLAKVTLAGMAMALVTATFLVIIYLQTNVWQIMVDAAGYLVGCALLAVGRSLTRRNRPGAAGYCLLLAILMASSAGEMVIRDATVFHILGSSLLIGTILMAVRPRRAGRWVLAFIIVSALVPLLSRLEPFPRHPLRLTAALTPWLISTTILFSLVFLWQLVRAYQQTTTIRTRLLAVSVVSTAAVAIAVTAVFAAIGFFSEQRNAIREVNLLATLYTRSLNTWTDSLQRNLTGLIPLGDATENLETLIREAPGTGDEYLYTELRYQRAYRELQDRVGVALEQAGVYDELFVISPEGYVILSTDQTQEGQLHRYYGYFQEGKERAYLQPPFHARSLAGGGLSIIASYPVTNEAGELLGVVAGRATVGRLYSILAEETTLAQGATVYLVSAGHVLLTGSDTSATARAKVNSQGIDWAVDLHRGGGMAYRDHRDSPVLGAFRWLPSLQVALLVEQDQATVFRPIYTALLLNLGVGLAAVLVGMIVARLITRSITAPLSSLATTAERIAAGDLDVQAKVDRQDETGVLARAFNSMTVRLRELVGSLEQRVADRTGELARRSAYLEAAAEVGAAATSILDPDELLRRVVELIRERFDLYYVGLFLLDHAGEWVELRAGTGEAGRVMLARGHRIRIGDGMIGWSAANGKARVALQAEDDTVRLATPELPHTRSEAAIPVRSRGQVLGALTIQDSRSNAFDQDTVAVFQAMADQVGVALNNAQLFEARQAAVEAERRAHGLLQLQAWSKLLIERKGLGFRSDARGTSPAAATWRRETQQAAQTGITARTHQADETDADTETMETLAVPIKIRDRVVAVLETYMPAGSGTWSEEEVTFLEDVADQLGMALENARLYETSQLRAERERTVSEITVRVRAAGDVDSILRTAVREVRCALGASHGIIRLGTETDLRPALEHRPADSSDCEQNRGADHP